MPMWYDVVNLPSSIPACAWLLRQAARPSCLPSAEGRLQANTEWGGQPERNNGQGSWRGCCQHRWIGWNWLSVGRKLQPFCLPYRGNGLPYRQARQRCSGPQLVGKVVLSILSWDILRVGHQILMALHSCDLVIGEQSMRLVMQPG